MPQRLAMTSARYRLGVVLVLTAAVSFAIPAGDSHGQAPRKGGVLRVGMTGEPPSLDAHATTTVITREIGINMFETVLAFDAKYQPVPHLIFRLDARRKDVRGHRPGPYLHFWNVWLDRR